MTDQPNDKPIYLGQILVIVPVVAGVLLIILGNLRNAPPLFSIIDLIRLRVPFPADVDYLLPSLVLTNRWEITSVLIAMVSFPPLPWIHAWLIGQAYRYIFPVGETYNAMRLALIVSTILMALAIPVAWLWLTTEYIIYGTMVGIIALIAVMLSVSVGVYSARRRQFTDRFVLKLALVTALLSLITPLALAVPLVDNGRANPSLAWWAVLTAIIGIIRYRRALTSQVERFHARASLWQIDRLALEIPLVVTPLLLPLAGFGLNQFFFLSSLVILVTATALITGGAVAITRLQGNKWALKKHNPLELHEEALFSGSAWRERLIRETIIWLSISIILAAIDFCVVEVSIAAFFSGIPRGG